MIKSGMFNSVNGDRVYKAEDFARYFATFIGNGVFPNPSTGLQVIENGDMSVNVSAGQGWINGYYITNDADYNLSLDVADGVLNRIDRVVMQLNYLNREITLVVKKGTFASSPVAPELIRDADVYELALADVYVGQGVVSVTQANITDTRLNSELCGIVHGTVNQVDTTTLFNQYLAWFEETKTNNETEMENWIAQEQADFDAWFAMIQGQLNGDIAGNLQNQITSLSDELTAHKEDYQQHVNDETTHGIGDKSTLQTVEKSTIVGAVNELFTNVSDGKSLVGGAITDVDPNVVIPTDPTFQDLADGVGNISTGKKFASGTVASDKELTISGLSFRPKLIYIYFSYTDKYEFVYNEYTTNNLGDYVWGFNLSGTYVRNAGTSLTVYDDGFSVNLVYGTSATNRNWIAFE